MHSMNMTMTVAIQVSLNKSGEKRPLFMRPQDFRIGRSGLWMQVAALSVEVLCDLRHRPPIHTDLNSKPCSSDLKFLLGSVAVNGHEHHRQNRWKRSARIFQSIVSLVYGLWRATHKQSSMILRSEIEFPGACPSTYESANEPQGRLQCDWAAGRTFARPKPDDSASQTALLNLAFDNGGASLFNVNIVGSFWASIYKYRLS